MHHKNLLNLSKKSLIMCIFVLIIIQSGFQVPPIYASPETVAEKGDLIVYGKRTYNVSSNSWNTWLYETFEISDVTENETQTLILANFKSGDISNNSEEWDQVNITFAIIDGSFRYATYLINPNTQISQYESQIIDYYKERFPQESYSIKYITVADGYGYHIEISNESGIVLKEEFIYSTTGVLLYSFSGKYLYSETQMDKTELQIIPKYSTIEGADQDIIKPDAKIDGFNPFFLFIMGLTGTAIILNKFKTRREK